MAENCQNIMRGLPLFMDKSNIASMFEMLDSSNKGSISFVQYKEGQYLLQTEVIICSYYISFPS